MLKGKNIVLGVTGGIACYKACDIVSRLKKAGANVDVIMTANSLNFVTPVTFETLSQNPVTTDTFKREAAWEVGHIALAKKADLLVIAPATANIIAKCAVGIADDMLTTTYLACKAPKLICPAMNTAMWDNQVTQENIATLKSRGVNFVMPEEGRLACGDSGSGKLADPERIVAEIDSILSVSEDLKGKRVMITAGGTEEPIDAVRVITNHSSGKMGRAIAEECLRRGAEVTVICGRVSVDMPSAAVVVKTRTTEDMRAAALKYADSDYIVMAAAPSDYKVVNRQENKIKADKLTLELAKNADIAAELGKIKKGKLVIFSAETENLEAHAKAKLIKKGADMVVANDVTKDGAGFNCDTNIVTIIKASGEIKEYGVMPKSAVAKEIADCMLSLSED